MIKIKKYRSKGVGKGSRDLLFKFWDPSISRERFELETSNLACRQGSLTRKMQNYVKGVGKLSRYLILVLSLKPKPG